MPIRVALHHETSYQYDRPVSIFPQTVRLRPAPHCRTPIESYSLRVQPLPHFLNWQQDPFGNYLARLVFPEKRSELKVEVDLIAEMTVINPFDFFLDEYAEQWPFTYDASLAHELKPYLVAAPAGPKLAELVAGISRHTRRSVLFLIEINQLVQQEIGYTIRLDPGVQTSEETLTSRRGSCRDSAWLLVEILRHLGLAARFVSGYLIQLAPDTQPLDGPPGPTTDFCDLHAWTEVYLPGAGWVGLDPTSGLLAGEGHLPLACTADFQSAAPISGGVEPCQDKFEHRMSVARVHEEPRVTKPYRDEQWHDIDRLGQRIDADLENSVVRLTMGGEPTFVSLDDMDGDEWNTAASGPHKRELAGQLIKRLRGRFAPGGFLHYGQGKWYPGEQLPRWALACHWRKDGQPIWNDPDLISDDPDDHGHDELTARTFIGRLAGALGVDSECIVPGYEDPWHYMLKERQLPVNVDVANSRLDDPQERERLARVFESGLEKVVGYALPLEPPDGGGPTNWSSSTWTFRQDRMHLIPGDSPMGYRLPLASPPWSAPDDRSQVIERDPLESRASLPDPTEWYSLNAPGSDSYPNSPGSNGYPSAPAANGHSPARLVHAGGRLHPAGSATAVGLATLEEPAVTTAPAAALAVGQSAKGIVRTALCVEARAGKLHIFMPPVGRIEDYLQLVSVIEQTAAALDTPVVIEGYEPPHDHRVQHIKLTPDPGVIEINVHPSSNWNELVDVTTTIYEEARSSRLIAEKFMLDGRHIGTCGGNHVVLGGATPADSPILRRPDLLRSLVSYWHNHPSLSYLFSGAFLGPTSQAPRFDEARHDSLYELEIACQQVDAQQPCPPWIVDRLFRHLLVDVTGNTHRAEFCIDKLYSPDSASGRLGLVELRGFEMPPHPQMSLVQQLLLRGLIARFWKVPYTAKLVRWGTILHDRFMLPHFVWEDFAEVIADLKQAGFDFKQEWFVPHLEFRFPLVGNVSCQSVHVELRHAIEPWNVLGEESGASGTARYVDSSLERLQVKVSCHTDSRHVVTCNGRRVPLHPTGVVGESVAGVRYRAWQPPSCLHPTIPVHVPLVFDVVDTWNRRSVGGCTWHVAHPGGRHYETFPVNANEAESRRTARFFRCGHTPGPIEPPIAEINPDFPLTLDLRRAFGN